MLVVKRKAGESIVIGDDIEITIVDIDSNTVKVAISAPRSITILRKELLKEVQDENKNAINFDKEMFKNLKDKGAK